jgi:peptidoglycan hydrolase CwlO-like protein
MGEEEFITKEKIAKYQWWIIILLGKLLFAIGLWYMAQINSNISTSNINLEKLNNTVQELSKVVQHVNDKQEFMQQKIEFHEKQIERLQDEIRTK